MNSSPFDCSKPCPASNKDFRARSAACCCLRFVIHISSLCGKPPRVALSYNLDSSSSHPSPVFAETKTDSIPEISFSQSGSLPDRRSILLITLIVLFFSISRINPRSSSFSFSPASKISNTRSDLLSTFRVWRMPSDSIRSFVFLIPAVSVRRKAIPFICIDSSI